MKPSFGPIVEGVWSPSALSLDDAGESRGVEETHPRGPLSGVGDASSAAAQYVVQQAGDLVGHGGQQFGAERHRECSQGWPKLP